MHKFGLVLVPVIAVIVILVEQFWTAQVAHAVDQYQSFLIGGVVFAVLIVLWGGYTQKWKWTGFSMPARPPENAGDTGKDTSKDIRSLKTLWDWMSLLIVPAVLAVGGFWFNQQQQIQADRTTADQAQEALLNTYIDRMSDLLLAQHPLGELPTDAKPIVARARTLETLNGLNGDRKGVLLQFLYESNLIRHRVDNKGVEVKKATINMSGANLRGVVLEGTTLSSGATISTSSTSTVTSTIDLSMANLNGANLNHDDLSGGSKLVQTGLDRAVLSNTNLNGADLTNASLRSAHLDGTQLVQATLVGTNLCRATGWTVPQLEQARSLQTAVLPWGHRNKGVHLDTGSRTQTTC